MTTWLFVALSSLGLLVVGAAAVKVFLALRGLAGELERTRRRLVPEPPPATTENAPTEEGRRQHEEISWRE